MFKAFEKEEPKRLKHRVHTKTIDPRAISTNLTEVVQHLPELNHFHKRK